MFQDNQNEKATTSASIEKFLRESYRPTLKRASRLQRSYYLYHRILTLVTIIGSTLVPFLINLNFDPKVSFFGHITGTIVSSLVILTIVIQQFFRFDSRAISYSKIVIDLKQAYDDYSLGTYIASTNNASEAIAKSFIERVTKILASDEIDFTPIDSLRRSDLSSSY